METIEKLKLNLTPNEVIGYRLQPDQWNWTVVLVKRHGKDSKYAGLEYATPVAYCKNMRFAVQWIMKTASALEAKKEQDREHNMSGSVASFEAMLRAFEKGEKAALDAVADLEQKLALKGINLENLPKELRA